MHEERLRTLVAVSLVVGTLLGMAGTFTADPELRSLLWVVDGTFLIVASALLAASHLRRGNEQLAAGFLVFLVGEAIIVYSSTMEIAASAPFFAAGAAVWAAGLALVSTAPGFHVVVRLTGMIAAALFAASVVQIVYFGTDLNGLSKPLPFFAFPFLAATLVGWAWEHRRATRG